ncbi:hypothetical protein ASPSYDRAFT_888993 [Aspergillus sydowii CBS 593.65]|uniref:Uncharacterized protein n=1 Tax=Aspergillus sydowii CBS 593.65 TaxID=1036612 RepID=A0A1L9TJT0_9EURO|nr:uncharacterized protein ASPSYDRAFT_888993 [Aspergillus sydowii CBS 593.65]OJJ59677.1 hypothetical protein ASPSYDRAFT_888993 [Aspergillus sydowii CBS 593.65]
MKSKRPRWHLKSAISASPNDTAKALLLCKRRQALGFTLCQDTWNRPSWPEAAESSISTSIASSDIWSQGVHGIVLSPLPRISIPEPQAPLVICSGSPLSVRAYASMKTGQSLLKGLLAAYATVRLSARDDASRREMAEAILLQSGPRSISNHSFSRNLGTLFLLGFRVFRLAYKKKKKKLRRRGNSVGSENIYEHPDRQGSNPKAEHITQHDILYSLGSMSARDWTLRRSLMSSHGYASALLVGYNNCGCCPSVVFAADSLSLKDHFMTLMKERLPIRMGGIYVRVVVCTVYLVWMRRMKSLEIRASLRILTAS